MKAKAPEESQLPEGKYEKAFEELNRIFSDSYKAPDMNVLELGKTRKKKRFILPFFKKTQLSHDELYAIAEEKISLWVEENMPTLAAKAMLEQNNTRE